MLSNSLNNHQSQNTLSFQAYKYNNKYPQNKIRYNNRYANIQNKASAPITSNNYNNQFLYKSENKNGYNKMSLASNSQNNDLVLINPKTYTSITKGKISTTQNSLNWNNIGFKEVKWKNKFSNKTYNNLLNNNDYAHNNKNYLFQSYNINNNYGATAKNLGFYNINSNTNNNKNILYSKKNGLINSYISTLSSSYNNNIKNNQQKNSLYEYYKNIVQIQNAREGLNSKILKNRMTDEQNIKKINKIQAIWKGVYVRELMRYYWNFNTFQEKLEKILDLYYKRYFLNKLENNYINKKQFANEQMVEKYNNLLEQFNKYKKDTEKNKINNEFITEKINFEILMTGETINSEEIISNRNEEKEEEIENIKLKSINKKKDNAFLKNFNKNLNIIKGDKFCFKKIKKENNIYQINNEFFSLINNISKIKLTDEEKKEGEKIKLLIIENQNGINYEKEKTFNNDDLSIEKKTDFNIIDNNKKEEEKIKKENGQPILLISNKSDFIIKNKEKEKCDKMTEITEEMNIIKINKNIFEKENNNLEYKKVKKTEIKNYNTMNEIEKGDALEINPYEIKRTKINKKEISKQNNINVIVSNNNIFNEKSKKNLIKIIFPIRLKEILIKYIKKNFFLYLLNQLKKISFISILIQIENNKKKKLKKKGMEKIKERMVLMKLRKYFEKEMIKYQIRNLLKKYLYLKWNKGLIDLSNIIINDKNNKSLK